ncbi:MAG: AAA family ATPase [Candidatus Paceibacterota bacterium]|jgi:ABC-type lipoprotein export system ATPase subunit
MNSKYPRGSEWRKWDLHIHTPKSIIQEYGGDNKTSWDAFITKLASLPKEIKVIGITDYLFCEGYEHLLTRKNEIPNIELIVPNIEFRLNTFSGTADSAKRHNFHILFDPSVSVQDIKDQLLNCLSTGYKIQDKTEWRQTPTVRSLQELGQQIKAAAPSDNSVQSKSDLEVGFENITYKREDIEELLKKNCFKGRFVTAIGYSEWDQSRWNQAAAEKRTIINTANFSLTSLDDPAKILENKQDLITNKLNSLILHSSDAHKIDRIGETLLWIKADPTFAGLKQVLNEPDARVFIGVTPPNFKPDHKVIKQISIPSSNGWFPDNFKLELNRDLIAVIGGRGSGKSALVEAIAYGAGSKDDNEDAFLKKAAKHKSSISNTKITIDWADDSKTEFEVGNLTKDQELVQYLPQGAVEDLCSHKNSEKLQRQIENVIFQALDETERIGASDFDELKSRILSSFQYEKDQVLKKINGINKKIGSLSTILKTLPDKEKTFDEKKKELERLNKSLPELPAEDKKGQEELAALSEIKKKFENKIIELQAQISKIIEIETKVKVFKTHIEEFREETGTLLQDVGITNSSVFRVDIDESGIKTLLDQKKNEISGKLKTLKEGAKKDVAQLLAIQAIDLPFDNLQSLNNGIDEKQKQTRAFETTKLKYQQQKKTALSVEASIKALENEITKIKTESTPEKERLEKDRMTTYCSYFKLLKEEKTQIEQLYKPLQDILSAGTDTDKKLVFEAQINYQLDSHYRSGLDIIDRTRRGNFREINTLKTTLNYFWDECMRGDFADAMLEAQINKILESFTAFEGGIISIEEQLRENYSIDDFFNWLFDPTNFKIISSLKFDDTDLYLLSPGQKGIILLMLYLEIDKGDYRPLIIDQPEENLDNLSVYKDLIDYFRSRKQYRQIIIVTHNPNLVVNTDAEQIIVSNYNGKRTPRLEYDCGSLEDQARQLPNMPVDQFENGIIEQVCDILEGGERAFDRRKKKYQISTRSQI